MVQIQEVINHPELIETYFTEEMARRVSEELGYGLPDDRLQRVAASARELAKQGYGNESFGEAFEIEFLLHGDPTSKQEIVGILKT